MPSMLRWLEKHSFHPKQSLSFENYKRQHKPDMSEVMTRKIESEIKNIASKNCTPRRQIYDSHATKESNFHPFVKLQWMNAGKKYHPYSPLLKVQKCSETEIPAILHRAFGNWPKSLTKLLPEFQASLKALSIFKPPSFHQEYFNFESQMQECLFRYRQALWRTCSRLGVGKDEEVLKWLKKLMPLPLFPENKIELCLHALAPTVDIKAKKQKRWGCLVLQLYREVLDSKDTLGSPLRSLFASGGVALTSATRGIDQCWFISFRPIYVQ